ncbi:MAG TPA: nodulation protein NfeD [Verrucomicrobiae bacterium]|nr:nodulation protein NfeD [Verrucomicrobiae bacterium]
MKAFASILAAAMTLSIAPALSAANVGLIEIKGAISPATENYISRAVDAATRQNDTCLIIQLDTPGGLVSSSQAIVQKFYASEVPIVVYVYPSGAGATSAGTYITLAADIAAMAPHTTIGAAHPVGANGEGDTNSIMWSKAENYVASWVKTIAEKRGRNVTWAEAAVRKSISSTSEEALDQGVIDLIATDVPDLLKKLDGRTVGNKTLHTANATIVPIRMNFRDAFLRLFLQPEMMFILMLVVIYGIIGELSNPGAILPGVAGVIAAILVLCLSAVLPINIAGLLLIFVAIVLFIIDVYTPTHGVLTGGGILAFFLGALMLFNRADPAFRLPLPYIIGGTVTTALFFLFIVGAGLRAQRLPVRAGRETMIGKTLPAAEHIDAAGGKVFVEGEWWNAVSDTPIETGQPVEIVSIEGLTLRVKAKAG